MIEAVHHYDALEAENNRLRYAIAELSNTISGEPYAQLMTAADSLVALVKSSARSALTGGQTAYRVHCADCGFGVVRVEIEDVPLCQSCADARRRKETAK